MQTLIELYDERPLENVLGVEVFCPERVVYVCPDDFNNEKRIRAKLEAYFNHRGLPCSRSFAALSPSTPTAPWTSPAARTRCSSRRAF